MVDFWFSHIQAGFGCMQTNSPCGEQKLKYYQLRSDGDLVLNQLFKNVSV